MPLKKSKNSFSSALFAWNLTKNHRKMPWKGEKDPYRIWLSEIILQQTRVEQGLEYYQRMLKAFPTVKKLAKADDNQVFKIWEGLGYYSRCRNLLETARFIAEKKKGAFPNSFEELKSLKGVGPYTAAAIASFAFDLPHAVVDGNVFRVLARVFGIELPIDSTEGKKKFTELANSVMDREKPATYNQAIMDFGATICKPRTPSCLSCPFKKTCIAFLEKKVNQLPVKQKKIVLKKRWFYFLLPSYRGQLPVKVRTEKDIWQGLATFPMLERDKETSIKAVLKLAEKSKLLLPNAYVVESVSALYRQTLSHQLIAGQFIRIRLQKKPALDKEWKWQRTDGLKSQAFPQLINQYLYATATQTILF
ncbi:MAG: A/G-specific adenine glycosylase [Bacteroidetes bacterium]|nr:A/G-specific adenine glycosylase [Bacteroidota bacterium]